GSSRQRVSSARKADNDRRGPCDTAKGIARRARRAEAGGQTGQAGRAGEVRHTHPVASAARLAASAAHPIGHDASDGCGQLQESGAVLCRAARRAQPQHSLRGSQGPDDGAEQPQPRSGASQAAADHELEDGRARRRARGARRPRIRKSQDPAREATRESVSRRRVRSLATIVVLTLAVAAQARAQGNSGKGKGHKSTPPSATVLPAPRGIGPSASPLAWVDDASLLAPGVVSLSISVLRWQGTDLSEVNFPVVDVSAGVLPRLQLGATVPRVVGSADPSGVVGGLGTSYLSAKI